MNIKQEIAELKTRIEQLEKQVKDSEKEEWPPTGEEYFIITSSGALDSYRWEDDTFDLQCKAIGNIFKTQQEAENEVEARKVVAEFRATEGRVGVFRESKCFGIEVYDICVEPSTTVADFFMVWDSEENVQKAIDKVGKDRIIAAAKHFGRV